MFTKPRKQPAAAGTAASSSDLRDVLAGGPSSAQTAKQAVLVEATDGGAILVTGANANTPQVVAARRAAAKLRTKAAAAEERSRALQEALRVAKAQTVADQAKIHELEKELATIGASHKVRTSVDSFAARGHTKLLEQFCDFHEEQDEDDPANGVSRWISMVPGVSAAWHTSYGAARLILKHERKSIRPRNSKRVRQNIVHRTLPTTIVAWGISSLIGMIGASIERGNTLESALSDQFRAVAERMQPAPNGGQVNMFRMSSEDLERTPGVQLEYNGRQYVVRARGLAVDRRYTTPEGVLEERRCMTLYYDHPNGEDDTIDTRICHTYRPEVRPAAPVRTPEATPHTAAAPN